MVLPYYREVPSHASAKDISGIVINYKYDTKVYKTTIVE